MDLSKIASRITTAEQIKIPVEQMVSTLQTFLVQKYTLDAAYRALADRLHGPWRDALVGHWQEHSGDERKMAYDIAMKIVGLGFDPKIENIPVPACNNKVEDTIACLIALEQETIKTSQFILSNLEEDFNFPIAGLRILIEGHQVLDVHHLDDLTRMSERIAEGAA
jgi:bacterioferritin (cytochrome b1)